MKSQACAREANWVLSKRACHSNALQMSCVEVETPRREQVPTPRQAFFYLSDVKFQSTDAYIARDQGNAFETKDFFVAKGDNLARLLARLRQYRFV